MRLEDRTEASPADDVALMRRMREHDDAQAFAELYDRHCRAVMGVAFQMLRDRAAAEDVAQEAFLSLWRARSTYRPDRSAPRTWLLTIARNRAIDSIRRRPSMAEAALEEDHLQFEAPDHTEGAVLAADEAATVRDCLSELPEAQRMVLELSYFAGLSQSELADRLSIPLGTVKGRMRLGMRKLASSLEPRLEARA